VRPDGAVPAVKRVKVRTVQIFTVGSGLDPDQFKNIPALRWHLQKNPEATRISRLTFRVLGDGKHLLIERYDIDREHALYSPAWRLRRKLGKSIAAREDGADPAGTRGR
jgi:hypothetical protein